MTKAHKITENIKIKVIQNMNKTINNTKITVAKVCQHGDL